MYKLNIDDTFDVDDSFEIHTSSSTDEIQIDPNFASGSISFDRLDPEKLEELRKTQLQKIKRLQDLMIEYLAENEIGPTEKSRWKSDFDKIQRHRDRLSDSGTRLWGGVGDNSVLDPSDLEQLNEIYKDWA